MESGSAMIWRLSRVGVRVCYCQMSSYPSYTIKAKTDIKGSLLALTVIIYIYFRGCKASSQ